MELLITVLTGIINIIFGLVAYLKNPKSSTNKLFALLTVIISIWSITNFFSLHSSTEEETLFWIRAVMVGTSFLGPTIFLLAHSFPKSSIQLAPKYIKAIVVLGLTNFILSPTSLMFSSVSVVQGTVTPTPGPAILLFAIDFVGLVIASFIVLIRKYIKAERIEKVQFKYLLLGISLTFTLVFITNFLFVLLNITSALVFLGPSFSLILVSFISYAIIKHRFLDIRFIVVRSVVYTLLVTTLALGYSIVLFTLGIFLTNQDTSSINLFTSTALALIFAFTLQPLLRFFEQITNKWLFKDRYDSNKVLHRISGILSSTLVMRDLSEQIFRELFESVKVSSGGLVVFDKQEETTFYPFHYDNSIIPIQKMKQLVKKAQHQNEEEHILVFEELQESPEKELMRQYQISIVLPLVVKKEIIGAFLLGEKGSGDIYSIQDIEVFKILGLETSLAIKNALSYEEIKRFSITLEEEVKRATDKLRKANSRLRELDDLKDEFVSIASHELRTPMTAIKSYLWLILNKSQTKIDAQTQKYLEISYKSTERLIRLVNDMLTVSRIERNKIELKMQRVDLLEVAQQVYEELKIKANEHSILFSLKAAEQSYFVLGDKEKLREVFQNMVGNALKFTPNDGNVSISFDKKAHNVVVYISDTGPGIATEDREKLFQKFQKIEYSYHSSHVSQPGSGLGLYISKQIISLHNGTIHVESKLGEGTTFIISIPYVK